jgi:molybdopterin-guanine dinucleotide biosynthesis protein A
MILAGGRSRRMGGGDKGLLPFRGQPMLGHVIARLEPQVARLALNANGDAGRFARFGLPVVADGVTGFPGPLAGILAAMDWAASEGGAWVVTVPCDIPFLPGDLVPRLLLASGEGARAAIAASGGRDHPVAGLWPVTLAAGLRAALAGGTRKVRDWTGGLDLGRAEFPVAAGDPFRNLNTPEDFTAGA